MHFLPGESSGAPQGGSKYFTKLNLRAGYHQIQVDENDIYRTIFWTHHGHYEYLMMPFSICNAPSTLQGAMNTIFQQQLRRYAGIF